VARPFETNTMPLAGAEATHRAQAHAKWAVRYKNAGDFDRAAAHAARAMEYRSAGRTSFGVLDRAVVAAAAAVFAVPAAAALAAVAAASGLVFPRARVPWPTAAPAAPAAAGFAIVNGLPLPAPCDLCGDKIDTGLHGTVFDHKSLPGKVVKVFTSDATAMLEARKHAVLNEIVKQSNGAFRSLSAVAVNHDGRVSIVMDKFVRPMHHYLFGDSPGKSVEDMRLRGGELREQLLISSHYKTFAEATKDLLVQYKILHRFGVAHGDAHAGNSGLVVGKDNTPRFVIGDPTLASVSPLSTIWDVGAKDFETNWPGFESIVTTMRGSVRQGAQTDGVFEYKLDERILNMDTDDKVEELLKKLFGVVDGEVPQEAIDKAGAAVITGRGKKRKITPNEIIRARVIIAMHNLVVDEMSGDWATLSANMGPALAGRVALLSIGVSFDDAPRAR
jgi:hypothetical protein